MEMNSRVTSRIAPAPFECRLQQVPEMTFPAVRRVSETSGTCPRRVAFAGAKVINEGEPESISEEEMAVRWWTQDGLDQIKQAAKEMSLHLRRISKEKGCYVETAHKKTSLMLANNFKELVKLSASSPDQDLRHWCARNDGRRGLERFACKEYCNSRKDDVIGARNMVFQEQKRQRTERVYKPDIIAKVSKEKTRRARTFALFLGEADALVARGSGRSSVKRSKVTHETPKRSRSKLSHDFTKSAAVDAPEVRPMVVESPVLCSSA